MLDPYHQVTITRDHLEKTDAAFRALDAWRAWASALVGKNLSDEEMRRRLTGAIEDMKVEQGKWR